MIRPTKNSKFLLIVGVVLLLGASIAAYTYINKSRNVSPTDSSAGVIKTCLSTVGEISNSYTCSGGKYAKATYKCVGGFTGTVGDGKACKTKDQLRALAEGACVKYANCQMLKPAYSEVFTSKTYSELNWTPISRNINETRTLDSNGLNLTTTKATSNIWHEIRLSDQNINEDFSMELKGVKVSDVDNAMTLFSLRGFNANSVVNWTTNYGPTNWNSMDLLLVRKGSTIHINSNRKINGVSKSSGKDIIVPAATTAVDFRITRLNKVMVLSYNIGDGYVEINRYDSHDWINNYVVLSAYTPKGKTTTASFKSFDYKNATGKFVLKTRYSEVFTKTTFSNDNWTLTWTDPGITYAFNTNGILIKDSGSNQDTQNSMIEFDRELKGDYIVELKNVKLDKASTETSTAALIVQGYTLANASKPTKWDQAILLIRKTATGYTVDARYSINGHAKWTNGVNSYSITDINKATNMRISSIANTLVVEAESGSGYKQLFKIDGVNWVNVKAKFGINKPSTGKTTATFGSFIYKAR